MFPEVFFGVTNAILADYSFNDFLISFEKNTFVIEYPSGAEDIL